ncbi:hypothetical protein [Desulfamplus magnetovallimortis]|uniref:hypothetical protein n=1 Tax=Desulfamplus magnetovallimortis TaxID=1246637 RepID=UPI00111AD7A7|nr:hypothetical protein [Desulfamplus magnetovallimortis]
MPYLNGGRTAAGKNPKGESSLSAEKAFDGLNSVFFSRVLKKKAVKIIIDTSNNRITFLFLT